MKLWRFNPSLRPPFSKPTCDPSVLPRKMDRYIEVTAGGNSYEPFDLGEAVRVEQQGPQY